MFRNGYRALRQLNLIEREEEGTDIEIELRTGIQFVCHLPVPIDDTICFKTISRRHSVKKWGSRGLLPEKLFKVTPSGTLENALLGAFMIDFHVKIEKLVPFPSFIGIYRFRRKS